MELRPFFGAATMATAAGVPPMGSVFAAVPMPASLPEGNLPEEILPAVSHPAPRRARWGRKPLFAQLCGTFV
ncbi:MAG: hypothetical protein ACREFD_00515 [Stellaceae bacterium]